MHQTPPNQETKQGRWEYSERLRFAEAFYLYGKEWNKVQAHVKTRDSS